MHVCTWMIPVTFAHPGYTSVSMLISLTINTYSHRRSFLSVIERSETAWKNHWHQLLYSTLTLWSWVRCYILVITSLLISKQENHRFETSLYCIEKPCLKSHKPPFTSKLEKKKLPVIKVINMCSACGRITLNLNVFQKLLFLVVCELLCIHPVYFVFKTCTED